MRTRHGFSSKSSKTLYSQYRHFFLYGAIGTLLFFGFSFFNISFESRIGLHKFYYRTVCFASQLWHICTGQQAIVQENATLRRQCQYYAYRFREQHHENQMLERLTSLLSMKGDVHFQYLYARILQRNIQCWWNTIWIDKGSDDGITEGLGVICPHGAVGKVSRVLPQSALIELITSPGFRSVVHIEGDMRPILYEGQKLLPWSLDIPKGKLSQLPLDFRNTAMDNLKIVSSDLSGTFPDGINYGMTLSREAKTERNREIFVTPFSEIQSLKEVIVLIPRHTIEKDDEI
jgi:rod shape-determining protein MreC